MKNYFTQLCIVFLSLTNLFCSGLPPFKLGLEALVDAHNQHLYDSNKVSTRFALITNHTGKDQQGNRTIDILLNHGIQITCMLAPEHGFSGCVPAEQDIPSEYDHKTDTQISS